MGILGRKVVAFFVWCMPMLCPFHSFVTAQSDIAGSEKVQVRQIIISGNKITKPRVILNELIFSQGDSIEVLKLGESLRLSRQNLLNTSLFNFVTISYALQDEEQVIFHVKVDERWYWWAFPIFEVADRNLSSFLENGDWSRVNYGVYLKRENFRGRKEVLKFKVRLGFATQLSLVYDKPEYKRKTGWGFEVDAKAHNQLPYGTFDNRQVFLVMPNSMAQYYYASSIFYNIRSNLYLRHQFSLSAASYNVNDTVVQLNPNYLTEGDTKMQYLKMSYRLRYDRRDSRAYPLSGYYIESILSKTGFGVLTNKINDFSLLARYQQLVKIHDRWRYAGFVETRLSNSDQLPYVMNAGLGYKNFLNGYELNVIDGTNNAMVQNKLIFTLLEPKVTTIGFMPLTQFAKIHYAFYLKTFFDVGYAWQMNPNPTNTMANELQYGYGVGLDFVTFYDRVFGFTYSANRYGQHGFFVHFNLEI